MKRRYLATVLPAAALGMFLFTGCEKTNEDTLKGRSEVVPHKEGTPDFKSYAEVQQYQAQEAAKNKAAGKGKAAPHK
jgi:hypothetical protein